MQKVTEVELIYRNKSKASERPIVSFSNEAYRLLLESWDMNRIELQEQFRVMLLDRKNGCLGVSTVATGGITNCLVDLKLVFAMALKSSATSVILAHNHPSGNLKVSDNDKDLTIRFRDAGKLLDMPVVDHIIVTKEGYTSLADEGFFLKPK